MMGEICILVTLLANILLTKQATYLNPVKTKDTGGFLWGISQPTKPLNKATTSYRINSLSIPGNVFNWKQKRTVTFIFHGNRNELLHLFFRQN